MNKKTVHDLNEQKKSMSFEIRVNAEWFMKQQHQIKYETVLFLQGKIIQKNDITVPW